MEDMKMVTINEIDSDSYYWDEVKGETGGVDRLKKTGTTWERETERDWLLYYS